MDLIVVTNFSGTLPLPSKRHDGAVSATASSGNRGWRGTHGASASESSTSYLLLSPSIIPLTVAKIQPDSAFPTVCPGALKAILLPGLSGSCLAYPTSRGSLPSAAVRLCLFRSLSLRSRSRSRCEVVDTAAERGRCGDSDRFEMAGDALDSEPMPSRCLRCLAG